MTTPTSYNPGGPLGDIPATPEPQSIDIKAGKARAWLTAQEVKALEKNAAAPASVVTTIDGVSTVIPRPARTGGITAAQLMTDDDLRSIGEEPLKFPVCEFPGCKDEGRNQIVSGAGKPLSISRKGELVFGDPLPVEAYEMSPNDKTRAMASSLASALGTEASQVVIGPSGQVAQQAPKFHVNVCEFHRHLPTAPRKPRPQRYQSGPYASYIAARKRSARVALRTRVEPAVLAMRQADGTEAWFIKGDDGVRPPRGIKLTELKESA
jgi:hypothetical protein